MMWCPVIPQRWLGRFAILFVSLVLAAASCPAAVEYLTSEWSFDTRTSSESCPAVAPDGTIYFGTFTGRLWAVGPDGSRKWIFRAGLEIRTAPALGSDGIIYFGSRDRKCYAVRPDGKEKWEFRTGGWVDSSPALAVPSRPSGRAQAAEHVLDVCSGAAHLLFEPLHLGVQLDKSEQRGDWSRRPLGEEQLRYAALDATCTLLLYEHQVKRGLRGDYQLRERTAQVARGGHS